MLNLASDWAADNSRPGPGGLGNWFGSWTGGRKPAGRATEPAGGGRGLEALWEELGARRKCQGASWEGFGASCEGLRASYYLRNKYIRKHKVLYLVEI